MCLILLISAPSWAKGKPKAQLSLSSKVGAIKSEPKSKAAGDAATKVTDLERKLHCYQCCVGELPEGSCTASKNFGAAANQLGCGC